MESTDPITEILDKIAKDNNFSVPNKYFESSKKNILSKTIGSSVNATSHLVRNIAIVTGSVAAIVAGIFLADTYYSKTSILKTDITVDNTEVANNFNANGNKTATIINSVDSAVTVENTENINNQKLTNNVLLSNTNKRKKISDFCSIYSWPSSICIENKTTLNAEVIGQYDYKWSNGSTSPKIEIDKAGIYSVTISSKSDITDRISKSINVTYIPVPLIKTEDYFNVCNGDSLMISIKQENENLYRYHWEQLNSNKHTECIKNPGLYRVKITGCQSYVDSFIVIPHYCDVNIKSLFDDCTENIVVSNIEKYDNKIKIFNSSKKLVYESTNYKNDLSVNNLENGSYSYIIIFKDGIEQTGKFRIKK